MTRKPTAMEEHMLANGGAVVSMVDGCMQKRVRHGPFDVITTEPIEVRGKSIEMIVIDDFCDGDNR